MPRNETLEARRRHASILKALEDVLPLLYPLVEEGSKRLFEAYENHAGLKASDKDKLNILVTFHRNYSPQKDSTSLIKKLNLGNALKSKLTDPIEGPFQLIKVFCAMSPDKSTPLIQMDLSPVLSIIQFCQFCSIPNVANDVLMEQICALNNVRNRFYHQAQIGNITEDFHKKIFNQLSEFQIELFPANHLWRESLAKLRNLILPDGYDITSAFYLPNQLARFCGRAEMIDSAVQLILSHSKQYRIVLTGLGGIGKSQTALEIAHRLKNCSSNLFPIIWWINAQDKPSLVSSMQSLGHMLGVELSKANCDDDIIRKVNERLRASGESWLLVVDNIEDSTLRKSLPDCGGVIIYTSQNQSWPDQNNLVKVGKLSHDESTDLFERMSERNITTDEHGQRLLVEIDGVPLALAQAASYLKQNSTMSCEIYLGHFDDKLATLMNNRGLQEEYRDSQSVWATWSIALDRVKDLAPLGAEYLQIISLLSPDMIPDRIFTAFLELNVEDEFERDDAGTQLSTLADYSLINRETVNQLHSIHRLLQRFVRVSNSFPDNESMEKATEIFLMLTKFKVEAEMKELLVLKSLIPHLLSLSSFRREVQPEHYHSLRMCELRLAQIYAQAMSNFQAAKGLLIPLKAEFAEANATLNLVETHIRLIDVYIQLSEHAKAVETSNQLRSFLKSSTALSPEKINSTLALLETMSEVSSTGSPTSTTVAKFKKIFDDAVTSHSPDDPILIEYMCNFGNVLTACGNPKQGIIQYERALELSGRIYGSTHLVTAQVKLAMARTHRVLANEQRAAQLTVEGEAVLRALQGDDGLTGATIKVTRAKLCRDTGKYAESEKLLLAAIPILEKHLTPTHHHVVEARFELGVTYTFLQKYDKALTLINKAVAQMSTSNGINNLQTLIGLGSTCNILQRLQMFNEMLQLAKFASDGLKRIIGDDDLNYANMLIILGQAHNNVYEFEAGTQCYIRALAIEEKYLPADNVQIADTCTNLGTAFNNLNQPVKALLYLQRSLPIRERIFGPNHEKVAITLTNMGHSYIQLKQFPAAFQVLQRALAIDERVFGPDAASVAETLQMLALAYMNSGRFGEAIPHYERERAIEERLYGSSHFTTARTYFNLAQCLLHSGRYFDALVNLRKTLKIEIMHYGPNHAETKKTADLLKVAEELCKPKAEDLD